jgi:hypothetical protein
MDAATVLDELKKLHREIETDAGKDPELVKNDVLPLDTLAGFDSLLIPNVIRGLAKAMNVALEKGVRLRNPYIDSGKKKLTLAGVAKRFCELYGGKTNGHK